MKGSIIFFYQKHVTSCLSLTLFYERQYHLLLLLTETLSEYGSGHGWQNVSLMLSYVTLHAFTPCIHIYHIYLPNMGMSVIHITTCIANPDKCSTFKIMELCHVAARMMSYRQAFSFHQNFICSPCREFDTELDETL